MPSAGEIWSDVRFVNNRMGPIRLTGSWQHKAYVRYLKRQLTRILGSAGGAVFEDTFANYPRWTAKSWALSAGSRQLPVASYFPYCTGGFTGARTPPVPAPSLAAPGTGGNYPAADGVNVVIIPPTSSATGNVMNLGTFTGTGTIDWTNAAGMIAYIDVSVEAASNAQDSLGTALRGLGERESGTASLEEAVAAYRAALEVRTRDRVPSSGRKPPGTKASH